MRLRARHWQTGKPANHQMPRHQPRPSHDLRGAVFSRPERRGSIGSARTPARTQGLIDRLDAPRRRQRSAGHNDALRSTPEKC